MFPKFKESKFNKPLFLTLFSAIIIFTGCQQKKTYTIYIAGDSTAAEKKDDKRPETGWGMRFQELFNDNVTIANHAKNGRSTRSFIDEGRWDSLVNLIQPDDYVFIQFGHNDESPQKVGRYTTPTQFYNNLCRFVDDVRNKNGNPVLLTPIMRRRYDDNSVFYDTHDVYPDMTRKVAKDKNVPLLDLHKSTEELLLKLGEEKSKSIFLIAEPGVWKNYPNGVDDNTHLNNDGAAEIAKLVTTTIKNSDLPIKKDLK